MKGGAYNKCYNMPHELLGFAAIYEDDTYKHFPVRASENCVEGASEDPRGARISPYSNNEVCTSMDSLSESSLSLKAPHEDYVSALTTSASTAPTEPANPEEQQQNIHKYHRNLVQAHQQMPSYYSQITPALSQDPFSSHMSYLSQYGHLGKLNEGNEYQSQDFYAPPPAGGVHPNARMQSMAPSQDFFHPEHIDRYSPYSGSYYGSPQTVNNQGVRHDLMHTNTPFYPSLTTNHARYVGNYRQDPLGLKESMGPGGDSMHKSEPEIRPRITSNGPTTESRLHGEKRVRTARQRSVKLKCCPICNKKLRRDLTRHMRTHQSTPGYECPFARELCNHRRGQFNRPYEYKKHLIASHFQCNDKNALKKAINLADKMQLRGHCQCGVVVESVSSWIKDHIESGLCPLLRSLHEDNLHKSP